MINLTSFVNPGRIHKRSLNILRISCLVHGVLQIGRIRSYVIDPGRCKLACPANISHHEANLINTLKPGLILQADRGVTGHLCQGTYKIPEVMASSFISRIQVSSLVAIHHYKWDHSDEEPESWETLIKFAMHARLTSSSEICISQTPPHFSSLSNEPSSWYPND